MPRDILHSLIKPKEANSAVYAINFKETKRIHTGNYEYTRVYIRRHTNDIRVTHTYTRFLTKTHMPIGAIVYHRNAILLGNFIFLFNYVQQRLKFNKKANCY